MLMRLLPGTAALSKSADVMATTTAAEAEIYGRAIRDDPTGSGFRVVNTGTIDAFASLWGKRRLTNAGQRFQHPIIDASVPSQRRRSLYGSAKVLIAKLAGRCEAFLDADGSYAGINLNCITHPIGGVSLPFLCGYLNSRLFMFFYGQLFGALRMSGGYYQFQAPQLRVMPVPNASEEDQEAITSLVLEVTRLLAGEGTSAQVTERLDAMDREFARIVGLGEDDLASLSPITRASHEHHRLGIT